MKLKSRLYTSDQVAELNREIQSLKDSLENAVEAVREVNQTIEMDAGVDEGKKRRKKDK